MDLLISEYYGYFLNQYTWEFVGGATLAAAVFGFRGAPFWMWAVLGLATFFGFGAPVWAMGSFVAVSLVSVIKPIRQNTVSLFVMKVIQKLGLIPKISDTEKAALDAGAVWVESEFFSGRPNFQRMMDETYPSLTPEEQEYLDGPVEELCKMIDDWKIYQNKEIPKEIWNFMREIKIFGMIVPKEYGGLEFSPLAHSEVIMKLSSRSIPVTITAMVPNSLGPAELLTHFGTKEQKDHYLPRLASGEYIPCFALTEQRAGSDAGSLESNGELFKKNGELWIRLNWNKRWITLAGVSDVLGLAFELRDPEHLIGDENIVGITCGLVPSQTKGVHIGRRHDPLGTPFYNCPTQGKDVELPASMIIGGIENAGKGWTMLMESLGAGRGISLPAQAAGVTKLVSRVTSAHTTIRRQFGLPLYKLEGLEEPLSRIGSFTYALDAMRTYTAGALNRGIKPAVVSAVAKYTSTEISRDIVNDGMDIMTGSGISRGPRNIIANIYQALPIGITVEGANILTRTLIIFGQGLFRAHPWAYKEVQAIENGDKKAFDRAFWGHIHHVVQNKFRVVLLTLSRGRLASVSGSGRLSRYAQKLSWSSSIFALLADVAAGTLGGELKKKEKLTGRFADVVNWSYIAVSVMRRFQAEGSKREDFPFVAFTLDHALSEIQSALEGILDNLKVPGLSWVFSKIMKPILRVNPIGTPVSDYRSHKAARAIVNPGAARDRVTFGIHVPKDEKQALGRLEAAYQAVEAAEKVERKISQAIKKGALPKRRLFKLAEMAKDKRIITEHEFELLSAAAMARWDACQVDDFSEEGYHGVDETGNKRFSDDYVGPAGAPQHYQYKKSQKSAA